MKNYPLDDERYEKLKAMYKSLMGTMDDQDLSDLVHEAASKMLNRDVSEIQKMVVSFVHEA